MAPSQCIRVQSRAEAGRAGALRSGPKSETRQEGAVIQAEEGSTLPTRKGPWPEDQHPCSAGSLLLKAGATPLILGELSAQPPKSDLTA